MLMKRAFIIWTPLHLYNAVRFILSRDLTGQCDAYYICQSEAMERYYNAVVKESIFNNVFFTRYEKLLPLKKVWEIRSIFFSPGPYVRHVFGEGSTDNDYDQLFISVPTRMNDIIIRANNCDEIVGYDDGIGSYVGNLYDVSLGSKYEWLKRIKGLPQQTVERVYLNNPEFSIVKEAGKSGRIVQEELSDEKEEVLFRAFDYCGDDPLTEFVYLNQPHVEAKDVEEAERIEREVLVRLEEVLDGRLSVRLHPRVKSIDAGNNVAVYKNRDLWELICQSRLENRNILVSVFSFAMFTPKLLFDKEPTLVFTYSLYPYFTDDIRAEYDDLIERIRSYYRDESKIINIKDFKDFIKLRDSMIE